MAKFAVQVTRPSRLVAEFIIEAVNYGAALDEARHTDKMGYCVWKTYTGNDEYNIEVTQLTWS